MKLSQYYLPTLKENPKEAEIVSHRLMLRAGMIRQSAAGIYSWLPLGLKVLRKIEQIVREEQNASGAVEVLMPTIQSADLWKESGRYDDYGQEMLRITDRHERDLLFGPTNEEMITDIIRSSVRSYKDLPLNLYHIQWKFRDEIRPRFGVMRGREFLMKDAYSFDLDKDAAVTAYQKMFLAYLRTFRRMGLQAIPMKADTGPIGGDLSHEFIILAETGESEVYAHKDWLERDTAAHGLSYDDKDGLNDFFEEMVSLYAATDEMIDQYPPPEKDIVKARGIEVGHIFYFGEKYSAPMKAQVQNKDGELTNMHMGSYGIGVSRLIGAIIEASHDENGIIWPEEVAPFHVGVLNLKASDSDCAAKCDELYAALSAQGLDVLYDDTDNGAGAKFANMDLIGVPWQIIVGPRGLKSGVCELKNRKTGEKEELSFDAAMNKITA